MAPNVSVFQWINMIKIWWWWMYPMTCVIWTAPLQTQQWNVVAQSFSHSLNKVSFTEHCKLINIGSPLNLANFAIWNKHYFWGLNLMGLQQNRNINLVIDIWCKVNKVNDVFADIFAGVSSNITIDVLLNASFLCVCEFGLQDTDRDSISNNSTCWMKGLLVNGNIRSCWWLSGWGERLRDMKCIVNDMEVMVRTQIGSNLGCVVLLS